MTESTNLVVKRINDLERRVAELEQPNPAEIRFRRSPHKNDNAIFVESRRGELLVVVSVHERRVYLEDKARVRTVSFPMDALETLIEAIRECADAECV